MSDKPTIRVVAAEAEKNGRYLITQRRPEATLPLLWEFPGGKVEPAETDAEALARELREEMDIEVEVGDEVLAVRREYDRYFIDFHVYSVQILTDEIKTLQVHDYRWVTVAELADYDFPAADQESVDQLLRGR
jgi:8-oxo-dGTP diphosphatase